MRFHNYTERTNIKFIIIPHALILYKKWHRSSYTKIQRQSSIYTYELLGVKTIQIPDT